MSLTPANSTDLAFARQASSIDGRSAFHAVDTHLPRGVWWVAGAVLALHWLAWIATPASLVDLSDNASGRTAMQVTLIAPSMPSVTPAPRNPAHRASSGAESPRSASASAPPTARAPATPQPQTSPPSLSVKPAELRGAPSPAPSAPAPDWRADISRNAGAQSAAKASSPIASAERAVTDQSQRAASLDTPSVQGNVAQRAFAREFGSGQAAVAGPKATREGGNPLGTRECIEMNGKTSCSRQRNLASDIDPFMKRERLFSPEIGLR
ncbi:hypothetical protein [Pandoraea apista]|uniref:Uncharacterized protein n=1 Tax=Pandoraea apista TaxID=93218 RepID=A0A5E5P9J5_9BURK|nr:hypothetical protein [Pandoraea apista]OXS97080.1 hypothetical protein B7H01_01475 [Pandoraea apista]VVG72875.1 hypothetical protein PAP18089_03878 [Pandoraea apista]